MTKPPNHANEDLHGDPSVLPEPWPGALAAAMTTPAQPSLAPDQAQAIKQRLMARVRTDASVNLHSVMRDDGWRSLGAKVRVKLLHDDGATFSWLLQLLPGGHLPEHSHADGAEECMIIEGNLQINGQTYRGGDYQVALPGSVHFDVRSDEGALVYLRSPSSRRKHLIPA